MEEIECVCVLRGRVMFMLCSCWIVCLNYLEVYLFPGFKSSAFTMTDTTVKIVNHFVSHHSSR